jgi:cytochrome c oxidase subunit 2
MPHSDTKIPEISIFNPQTAEARNYQDINIYFIIASSFIMLLVIVLLIYVSFKYRAKPGDAEPKQIHNNKLVETFMIGVPFLMVSFFFYLTVKAMSHTEPEMGSTKPTVIITGNQWWWKVTYPGTNDFWVPSFGPKADMIPGAGNHLWLTIDKPGTYYGVCSEFCGKQHAWMRIKVIAQNQIDYNRWLIEKSKNAEIPSSDLALKGQAIFNKASCAGCHQIKGTSANGHVGPDLTHLASRGTILAGLLKNTKQNLYSFLNNPDKVKPGVNMPKYIFKKDSLNALVAYLNNLK